MSNFFNSSGKKNTATTSKEINNSFFPVRCSNTRLLRQKLLFYYKHQDFLHAFQMGICILDEAKFIHILVANIKAEI